jgi:antitoxin VapB
MPLSIKNPETEKLARQLARRTGASITDAVTEALRDRLRRIEGRAKTPSLKEKLLEIGKRCASLPVYDARTPDEILEDAFDMPSDGH